MLRAVPSQFRLLVAPFGTVLSTAHPGRRSLFAHRSEFSVLSVLTQDALLSSEVRSPENSFPCLMATMFGGIQRAFILISNGTT